jgi:hypothetical protein
LTRKKPRASNPQSDITEKTAKSLVNLIREQIKGLPEEDQVQRVKAFCDALDAHLRPAAKTAS